VISPIKQVESKLYQHDERERSALPSFFSFQKRNDIISLVFFLLLIYVDSFTCRKNPQPAGVELVTVRLMFHRPTRFTILSCLSLGIPSIIILPFWDAVKSISTCIFTHRYPIDTRMRAGRFIFVMDGNVHFRRLLWRGKTSCKENFFAWVFLVSLDDDVIVYFKQNRNRQVCWIHENVQ
jgi:hypothetical protein